jgi:hypothetical protein
LNKKRLYWVLQITGWLFYGCIQIFLYAASGQPIDKMLLIGEGLQILLNIFLTHSLRFLILRFRWLHLRLYKLIPLVIASVVIMSMMGSVGLVFIFFVQGDFSIDEVPQAAILANLLESIFVFFFWSLAYFIFLFFERYNLSLKKEAITRQTELNNLKAQLNPHFIFNALNSIRALVDEDPVKSKKSINQLSNILRNSLNADRRKLVSFEEEVRMVMDYLALEKIRYEERLHVVWDVDENASDFYIPPIMLQTLVENAIKHGIANRTEGGEISIVTRVVESELHIAIRNTGNLTGPVKESGFGLRNTRKRLRLLYGESARFSIKNENKDFVITELVIPKTKNLKL